MPRKLKNPLEILLELCYNEKKNLEKRDNYEGFDEWQTA